MNVIIPSFITHQLSHYKKYFFSLSFFLLSACSPQQEVELRIGTNQWIGYEPLYLAQHLGYLDMQNITLFELPSTTEVFRAFKRHQINVAATTLDEALQLAQTEKNLRIFLVLDISNGADKVMAKPPIKQLSDIKGHCVITENTAVGALMLYHLLDNAQLTEKDITIQPATADQHLEEAQKGTCKIIVTFEPTASKLARKGFIDIFDSTQLAGKIVDVLVSRKETLIQARQTLQHLVSAHWKTLKYMKTHQEQAYQYIAHDLDLSLSELAKSYQGLILPDKIQNQQLLSSKSENNLRTTASKMREIMLKVQLLQSKPDIQQLITDELVK